MATLAELVFEEYPDDVITVRLSPVPMREYFALLREFDALDEPSEEPVAQLTAFFDHWTRIALVGWTFPSPLTGEGMLDLDLRLATAIVRQWMERIKEVPAPLPVGSSGSRPSPEPSTQPPANRSQRRQSSRTRRRTTPS